MAQVEFKQGKQAYSSKCTSNGNATTLPAVFTTVQKLAIRHNNLGFKRGTLNLDYGGGHTDIATHWLQQYGVTNLVYDPYNRTKEHNARILHIVNQHGVATATCSNVLNVIAEKENRIIAIRNIYLALKPNGVLYVTVYEGDKSGVGKANKKKDSYQLNQKLDFYKQEIESCHMFSTVLKKYKTLICIK